MSEYKLYGDLVNQPTYIKRASGLVMPGSVEQAAELVRDTPYLLVHHFANLLRIGSALASEGEDISFLDLVAMYHDGLMKQMNEPKKQGGMYDFMTAQPLTHQNIYGDYAASRGVSGIDHTYDQDTEGDLEPMVEIYAAFVQGLAEKGRLVVGINNSLDPLCIGNNLGAIGSHCHLGWLGATSELDDIKPRWHTDTFALLGPVRWYVYSQLARRCEEIEAERQFLSDMHEGKVHLFLESTNPMGVELLVPEIHIDLSIYQRFDRFEHFHYKQYSFSPTGLTNALSGWRNTHPSEYALAADIEQKVTLNNFQQYIAEHL